MVLGNTLQAIFLISPNTIHTPRFIIHDDIIVQRIIAACHAGRSPLGTFPGWLVVGEFLELQLYTIVGTHVNNCNAPNRELSKVVNFAFLLGLPLHT